jgi:hypothetical protein
MAITTEAHWELHNGRRTSYAVATVKGDTVVEAANAAAKVAELANKNAPRKTGRLSKSYGVTGSGTERTVRSRVPYSGHQEWGAPRAHVKAQPHLRPALKAVEAVYNTKPRARARIKAKR